VERRRDDLLDERAVIVFASSGSPGGRRTVTEPAFGIRSGISPLTLRDEGRLGILFPFGIDVRSGIRLGFGWS